MARWGPDENPYPDFGDTFEDLYKGTADLFLWPTLYLWEFPKIDDLRRSTATAWAAASTWAC